MGVMEGDKESLGALPRSRWLRPNPLVQIWQLSVASYSQQPEFEPIKQKTHCCDE